MAKIPNSVITVVSETLGWHYTHSHLNSLFVKNGAPEDTPIGNKVDKCSAWLQAVNDASDINPIEFLGKILEDYMDYEISPSAINANEWEERRERVRSALGRHALVYRFGGYVTSSIGGSPVLSLEQALRRFDMPAVQAEFARAIAAVETDPPSGLTAACSMLESLFKIFIEDEALDMPGGPTIKPLWVVVSKSLGLDPSALQDDDLKKILSGMTSIVDGLGSLRTHAGSAHGQGRSRYKVQARHARVAINTSHTLATFVLETWEERKKLRL